MLTEHTKSLYESAFKRSINGLSTGLFVLERNNIKAAITTYGARLVSLWVPDKNGILTDVVMGFNSVDQYIDSTEPYYGATIGRYANRIANGTFSIDGVTHISSINNPPNMLHGGKNGFQNRVFNAQQRDDSVLELTYLSEDEDEGFPGNLHLKVTYTLTDQHELKLNYEASTDKKTVLNITNHTFWNLNGEGSGTILKHELWIPSGNYIPIDSTLIPTGKIETVKGTPFDFTAPTTIGEKIDTISNMQLRFANGYDHNYVLNFNKDAVLNHAASVIGDRTKIEMEVFTSEPGLQFYSGNSMEGKNIMKSGKRDDFRTAFTLETQHFPDSPNQETFPSTTLDPNQKFSTETVYKFSI